MARRVFVSYRRKSNAADAQAIAGRLSHHLGARNVFVDVNDLVGGVNFPRALPRHIRACVAVIVVIGPDWLGVEPDGRRRIDDPDDWVRLEIREALRQDIIVIPVLLPGATPPRKDELPEELRPLADHMAVEYTPATFKAVMDDLARSIRRMRRPLASRLQDLLPRMPRLRMPRVGFRQFIPPTPSMDWQVILRPAEQTFTILHAHKWPLLLAVGIAWAVNYDVTNSADRQTTNFVRHALLFSMVLLAAYLLRRPTWRTLGYVAIALIVVRTGAAWAYTAEIAQSDLLTFLLNLAHTMVTALVLALLLGQRNSTRICRYLISVGLASLVTLGCVAGISAARLSEALFPIFSLHWFIVVALLRQSMSDDQIGKR